MKTNYKKELMESGYYNDVIKALVELVTLDKKSYLVNPFIDNGEWNDKVTGESLKAAAHVLIGVIEGVCKVDDIDLDALIRYMETQFDFESHNYVNSILHGCNPEKQKLREIAVLYLIWSIAINADWNASYYPEAFEEFSVDIVG